MDTSKTINSWQINMELSLSKDRLLDFNEERIEDCIKIINDDEIGIFNKIINGETLFFAELKDTTFINKEMKDYLDNNPDINIIFSSLNSKEQKIKLDKIIKVNNDSIVSSSNNIMYITFGSLSYIIDNQKFQAPLVFVPIRIDISSDGHYKLTSLAKEIYLNYPLINKLKKVKKIDLSYPIDSKFSLSEYLYYLSVKVKPINWFVNNLNYISCFDFSLYFDIENISKNKALLSNSRLVKKIDYLNSEFFSLKKSKEIALNNKYLSLLDMQYEEYFLLKTITKRDDLLIRYYQQTNKYHFIKNIILSYLLNNKKVLLVYSNNNEKEELIKELKKNALDKFILDLNLGSFDKDSALSSLSSYEKYNITYNSLHPIAIDEDVTRYYDLKNQFQSLVNSLKTTKNALGISINKLINNYYALDKYPLIDIKLKEIKNINQDILEQYLSFIKEFSSSISNLNCPYKEHPFYGFSKKQMYKEDYLPLKDNVISLSQTINDAVNIYTYGKEKYYLPNVNSLKEMKALLNVLSFIDYYKNYPLDWLKEEKIDETYDFLKSIYLSLKRINKGIEELLNPYGEDLKEISTNEILKVLTEKKSQKELKKIQKKYFKKKIPLSEVSYVLNKLLLLLEERENLENSKLKFDSSYIQYLSSHSFEEFREVVNHINIYRYNINYIKDKEEFDIIYQIQDTSIESSKHRQVMQLVFNSILESTKIIQDYFDKNYINFETMSLNEYFDKVVKMSSNFSSINNYITFYTSLNKVNHIASNLGDKLLEFSSYNDYEKIFLKRVYFDLLNSYLNNKEMSSKLSRENISLILNNFKDSDNNRIGLINKVICNHINNNVRTSLSRIKETEGKKLVKLLEEGNYLLTLEQLCSNYANSIYNFKPCILISYKQVSSLLNNDIYHFDLGIILANRSLDIKDVLASIEKCDQIIVSDQEVITQDARSSIISSNNPQNLVFASKNTFSEMKVNLQSHDIYSSMQNNLYDLDFKAYLSNKLKEYGFDVGINRSIEENVIDILVKVKNSPTSIAIMVDHLPYYSPEEASECFSYQDKFLTSIGYYPYRIFTSLFFLNEEEEFKKLVDYIVSKSKLIPQINVKKSNVLLMDYLFPLFVDPRKVYYEFNNLEDPLDKLYSFLVKTCPISLEETRIIFNENIEENINVLLESEKISLIDGFIYIPNQKVVFRRVDRTKDTYRPLDLVSEKEIFDAVYQVINSTQSLKKDTLIKMILLSLGYKKANKEKYEYVEKKINYLLEKKIIFIENDIIYKNI
ncbi:MAG: DUF4011 domain-containing protein [Bacillales bacterium]|nr:DUF4011 domain-containing protein [Bacillales bacterium]